MEGKEGEGVRGWHLSSRSEGEMGRRETKELEREGEREEEEGVGGRH